MLFGNKPIVIICGKKSHFKIKWLDYKQSWIPTPAFAVSRIYTGTVSGVRTQILLILAVSVF